MKTIRTFLLATSLVAASSQAALACVDTTGMTEGELAAYASHAGVNTAGLNPQFQGQLGSMMADLQAAFPGVQISSGYRSVEHQQRLWDAALVKYGDPEIADNWVARPGNSMHNYGAAVDLVYNGSRVEYGSAVSDWLGANLSRYGLTRPLGNEGWHIEPEGGRAALQNGGQTPEMAAMGCDPANLDMPTFALMNWLTGGAIGQMPPGTF